MRQFEVSALTNLRSTSSTMTQAQGSHLRPKIASKNAAKACQAAHLMT
jgi:hypothetical protein